MALKDSLTKTNLGLGGVTPSKFGVIAKQPTLHDQYSINGKPNLLKKPIPSVLDLNGATPAKYLDNLPE